MSPRRPPTAKATITDSDEGSILGGHKASRKFGGPDIYSVPSRAFTAGLPGNRTEKILDVKLEVGGLVAALWRFSSRTRGHCYCSLV